MVRTRRPTSDKVRWTGRILALGLALFGLAGTAQAYDVVRTEGGDRIRFERLPVAVFLQSSPVGSLTVAQQEKALLAALATWNAVPGAGIQLAYGGLVREKPLFDVYVAFETGFDTSKGDVLGRTLRVHEADGRLTRAEIYLNADDVVWTPTAIPPSGKVVADLQGQLTHQLGHALGLDHSRLASATMYFFSTQASSRTLEGDDLRGARFAWPGPKGKAKEGRQCDACDEDGDCTGGGKCLAWPDGARHCALPCTGHSDCPIGSSCGSYASGQACLPNDRHCKADAATSGLGELCASDAACGKSRICLTTGAFGFCTQACPPCPSPGQCFTTNLGNLCLVRGEGDTGEPCVSPSDCDGLVCAPSIHGGGRCTRTCAGGCPKGGTCGSGGFCEVPQADGLPIGWPCESGFDCQSGVCTTWTGGRFPKVCSKPCTVALDCPDGTGCVSVQGGERCLPPATPVPIEGMPCLASGSCGSKLVCDEGLLPEVGACREPCDPFSDQPNCPAGQACAWIGPETGACRPVPAGAQGPGQACGPGQRCRPDAVCVQGKGAPVCHVDCDAVTGTGCAGGETCASAAGLPAGQGHCADSSSGWQAVPFVPPPPVNHAARAVSLPDVVPAAEFTPEVEAVDNGDGCRAARTSSPVGPLLFTLGLAAVGMRRRGRRA